MKMNLRRLFILLTLIVSACSVNPPASSHSAEVPPTPYPDTPSPARIDAPLVESPSIIDLDMFSELNGWAVTDAEIVRTNDGGITWYDVTPPGMEETGYSVDPFLMDDRHAWVLRPDLEKFPNNGTLSRTSDGGRSWDEFTVPFSRGDLYFVDEDNGWMLADLGAAVGSNAVSVFQTRDGGANWNKKFTNDPNDANAASSLPVGGIKSDIVPLDRNTAWVTGVVYTPGEVYLYRTDDGGRNWKQIQLALPPGTESFELGIDKDQMKFVSPRDGFLALRLSGEATQTAIYVTHDGGDTWNLTPTLIDGAGATSFLSDQDVVLYNGQQFYVTHDAGQIWVLISPDITFGETFVNMEFVNPLAGWVITMDPSTNHRSLYRTYDGGSTWLPAVP